MAKAIAVLCLSNWGGIAILEIDDREETLTYHYYDNEPQKVQYDYEYDEDTEEFEVYFMIHDEKYYLHEFMAV